MFLHQRYVPGLATYSYLIGDEDSGMCAVLDPLRDVEPYVEIAAAEELSIAHVLETHVHADFVSGARELKARLGGAPVIHCSAMGGAEWLPRYADHPVQDGDEIRLGRLRLQAVHSPGHTPEHLTWALYDEERSRDVPWLLFTGDFVFVGDVGRPDLLGEAARVELAHRLYSSLFERLASYPDFAEVHPGHGAGSACGKALGTRGQSTLGYERRFNRSLERLEEPAWVERLMDGMPAAPPYFSRMKRVNVEGPAIVGERLPGRPIGAAELERRLDAGADAPVVLDVRAPDDFAGGSIPGALNIPLHPNLATWAGWILPADRPIVLVARDGEVVREATTQLLRVGFDRVEGHLDGGLDAWRALGVDPRRFEMLAPGELAGRMAQRPEPFLLDVRSEGEWREAHLAGSRQIMYGEIERRLAEIPSDRPVILICGTGARASIALSLLAARGHASLANVAGGLEACRAAGLPLTR